jgi:hypothetical protein
VESFHVYVVGAKDPTTEGLARVADAIAHHYGIAADDLIGRLNRGRFRVKTGVDRATADQYQRDLDKLGARVAIEAASPADRSTGTSLPPPNTPRTTSKSALPPPVRPPAPPSTPPPPPPMPQTSPPVVARAPTPPPGVQSGLSAAYSGEMPAADLSAFDKLDRIALSSLDGVADSPIETSQYDSPQFGPPMDLPKPSAPQSGPTPGRPRDVPVDQDFAPPDAGEAEVKVDIAPDEIEHRARRRTPASMQAVNASAPAPPPPTSPTQAAPTTPMLLRKPRPSAPVVAGAVVRQSKLGPFGDERVRFAVGVVVAILLGFVPAHFIAGSYESSAYHAVDTKLDNQQELAETIPEDYAKLDTVRDHALSDKKDARRNVALVGLLVWAAAGAGIGYVWFKRVPWDRLG